VDALLRHLLHARNRALGVFLVVEGHDLDVIDRAADINPAQLVQPGRPDLHRPLVGSAPGGGGARGNADKADLKLGVFGMRGRQQRKAGNRRHRGGLEEKASVHGGTP